VRTASILASFAFFAAATAGPPALELLAQTNTPPALQSQTPAQRVVLNVVASDGKGRPVEDLTEADFQVFDQGKRQQILFFRPGEGVQRELTSTREYDYSNQSAAVVPHATVILFDFLNTNRAWSERGRQALIRALEPLDSGRNLYLYVLGDDAKLHPVHPLPARAEDADKSDTLWIRQVGPSLDQALQAIAGVTTGDMRIRDFRIDAAVNAIENLTVDMSSIPGRKDIVWITGGSDSFTLNNDFGPWLAQQNVSLDTLLQGDPGDSWTARDLLEMLSEQTGGAAFPSVPVDQGIAEVFARLRAAYRIEYDAQPAESSGEHRKVRVTCSRKGIRLQPPQDYTAFQRPLLATYEALLDAASYSPLDVSEIGLSVTASPAGEASGMYRFHIRINAQDVLLAQQNSRYNGELTLEFIGYSTGRPVVLTRVPLKINLSEDQWNGATKEGIKTEQTVSVTDHIHHVRVVALDRRSGSVGSLTLPTVVATRKQS
jgi:VWFA-related protein